MKIPRSSTCRGGQTVQHTSPTSFSCLDMVYLFRNPRRVVWTDCVPVGPQTMSSTDMLIMLPLQNRFITIVSEAVLVRSNGILDTAVPSSSQRRNNPQRKLIRLQAGMDTLRRHTGHGNDYDSYFQLRLLTKTQNGKIKTTPVKVLQLTDA